MKCPHCGYTNPEDMFRCPRCRKFMDPELNLIDDIDKAIYDYEHNYKNLHFFLKYPLTFLNH